MLKKAKKDLKGSGGASLLCFDLCALFVAVFHRLRILTQTYIHSLKDAEEEKNEEDYKIAKEGKHHFLFSRRSLLDSLVRHCSFLRLPRTQRGNWKRPT